MLVSIAHPAAVAHRAASGALAMGSYGDEWVQCEFCDRWGKCTRWWWDYTRDCWADGFFDVDGVGVLCEACLDRGCPPHAADLQALFRGIRLPDTATSVTPSPRLKIATQMPSPLAPTFLSEQLT